MVLQTIDGEKMKILGVKIRAGRVVLAMGGCALLECLKTTQY